MPPSSRREAEIAVVRPAQPRPTRQAPAGAERRLPGAMEVPIDQVVLDPSQPRQDWGHADGVRRLAELGASIAEFGVLQTLLVREAGTVSDGRQRYIIIAGARRWTAAERAGLSTVPVVVRGVEATRVRVLQLIENLQRQELSPLDEARAYQELIDLDNLTPPGLASRLHISAQHVRDRLRVLADQVLADAVERQQISATAARDIMQLPDEEVMAFRARVQAGEALRTNDVAAARARLAEAGIVNPRRKLPRPVVEPVQQQSGETVPEPHVRVEQTPFVLRDANNGVPMATVVQTDRSEKKQTSFVPDLAPPVSAPPKAVAWTGPIRLASPADIDGLRSLFMDADSLHGDALPDVFQSIDGPTRSDAFLSGILSDLDGAVLVAEGERELVGMLYVSVRNIPEGLPLRPRRYGHVDTVSVRRDNLRRGIGRSLMAEAERWAAERGLERIELTVYEFNQGAIAFYDQLGYATVRRSMAKTLQGT